MALVLFVRDGGGDVRNEALGPFEAGFSQRISGRQVFGFQDFNLPSRSGDFFCFFGKHSFFGPRQKNRQAGNGTEIFAVLFPECVKFVGLSFAPGGTEHLGVFELADLAASGGTVELGVVACIAEDNPNGQVYDSTLPPSGSGFFYLGRKFAETDYGKASDGLPRLPTGGDCNP